MISRKIALEIAEEVRKEHMLGPAVLYVLAFDEIKGRRPIMYDVLSQDLWVAYIEPHQLGLQSSTVVAIERNSGKVVYYGNASDEG